MASVFPNNVGLVFIIPHDEVKGIIAGTTALGGTGGLVSTVPAAAGIHRLLARRH